MENYYNNVPRHAADVIIFSPSLNEPLMEKHISLFKWIIPLLFALAGTAWGNLTFLDEYLFSMRRMLASAIVFMVLFLAGWQILRKVPTPDLKFKPLLAWLIPALIAILLSLQFPGTLAYLEQHSLEITAAPDAGEVVFIGINSGSNDISLSQVNFSGEWQRSDEGIEHPRAVQSNGAAGFPRAPL